MKRGDTDEVLWPRTVGVLLPEAAELIGHALRQKTSAPASHLGGQRGRYMLSGAHSLLFSLQAGPDVWDERIIWRDASPRLSALSRRNLSQERPARCLAVQ